MKNVLMAVVALGFMTLATGCGGDEAPKTEVKKAEPMKCGAGKCGAGMNAGTDKNSSKKCGGDKATH
jgi:uncharacterized low-complexity protein